MRSLRALWRSAIAAAVAFTAVAATGPISSVPAASAERPFMYGVTVADASAESGRSFDLARQAGFTHVYVVLDWSNVEPEPGRFAWELGRPNDLDNFLVAARATGLRLIVRLGRPAAWAGTPATLRPADFERHAAGVAARAKGVAVAYEILNEPNLAYEWGGTPDPAAYARLLAGASRGIKQSDASALVVAAGLAPHTGNAPGTIEDVDFLRGMYRAGARGTFDVLGIHPYGGNTAPDQDPITCGICFRRAEVYRQVMVEQGDSATPAWITEFGYLHTTSVDLGQYNWLKLSPEQQATYLTSAFTYSYQRWPWLTGIVAFNLDFNTVPWNPKELGAYWFALLNPDRSPRPAYYAMRDLAKPGASSPLLVSQPAPAAAPVSSSSGPSTPPPAPSTAAAPAAQPQPSTAPTLSVAVTQTTSVPASPGSVICRTSGGKAICGLVEALASLGR